MKLGKLDYKPDDRTIKMGALLNDSFIIPSVFDFDKRRAHFPTDTWSNTRYGDCVIAGRTNHLLRLERVETRRTPKITAQMVVDKYFELSDGEDSGLVVLDALKDWRSNGWDITSRAGVRNYKIEAFGSLNPRNRRQLRLACFLLHGVQFGFSLPISAQAQTDEGLWDVVDGPDGEPGSWGGHLVAGFAYDADSFTIITWGQKVKVTNAFIEKYCDEAWACVDSLDPWRGLDIDRLQQILRDIGAGIN